MRKLSLKYFSFANLLFFNNLLEPDGVKSVVSILFVLLHLAFLQSVSPAKIPALVGEIFCSDTPILSFPDEGILPETSGYPSSKGIGTS
jgi:hypothetical protein